MAPLQKNNASTVCSTTSRRSSSTFASGWCSCAGRWQWLCLFIINKEKRSIATPTDVILRKKKEKKKTLSGAGPSVDPVCLSPARSYKVLFVFYWPTHWDSVLSLCCKPDAAVAEDKPEVNGNQQDNGAVQGIHTHKRVLIQTQSRRYTHVQTTWRKVPYVNRHTHGRHMCVLGPIWDQWRR